VHIPPKGYLGSEIGEIALRGHVLIQGSRWIRHEKENGVHIDVNGVDKEVVSGAAGHHET
jgi:hypothetical protein